LVVFVVNLVILLHVNAYTQSKIITVKSVTAYVTEWRNNTKTTTQKHSCEYLLRI